MVGVGCRGRGGRSRSRGGGRLALVVALVQVGEGGLQSGSLLVEVGRPEGARVGDRLLPAEVAVGGQAAVTWEPSQLAEGERVDGQLVQPADGLVDPLAGLPVRQLDLGVLGLGLEDGVDAAADHPGAEAEDDADLGLGWRKGGVAGGRDVAAGPFDQLGGQVAAGAVVGELVGLQQVGEVAGTALQQAVDHRPEPGRRRAPRAWPDHRPVEVAGAAGVVQHLDDRQDPRGSVRAGVGSTRAASSRWWPAATAARKASA